MKIRYLKTIRIWAILSVAVLLSATGCRHASTRGGSKLGRPSTVLKFGYMDTSGRVVIPPQFDSCKGFREDRAAVLINGKWGYIDKTGRITASPRFEEVYDYHSNLSNVLMKGGFGYIDKAGKLVIPPKFGVSGEFSEGLAAIPFGQTEGATDDFGYIGTTGRLVIGGKYHEAGPFQNGKALVYDDHGGMLIDRKGRILFRFGYYTPESEGFHEGLGITIPHDRDHRGYVDERGRLVIKPIFGVAMDFHDGRAAVKKRDNNGVGKWGFIDRAGQYIVRPRYDEVKDFSDGMAVVEIYVPHEERRCGYIDRSGRLVIPILLGEAYSFHDGLALVMKPKGHDWQWCYIDKKGRVVISPETPGSGRWGNASFPYNETDGFSEGLAPFDVELPASASQTTKR